MSTTPPRWPFDEPAPPPDLTRREGTELDEELAFHVDAITDELIARGVSPEAAREQALARFGDPRSWRQELERDRRRAGPPDRASGAAGAAAASRSMMTNGRRTMGTRIVQDLRYAWRGLRRHPVFALMAVLTLTVALAGNTAIFSVLDASVLRALPFPEPERLVFVNGVHRTEAGEAARMASVPEFRDWRERVRSVTPLAAASTSSVTIRSGDESDRVGAEIVSEGYFDLLGASAQVGRTFNADESRVPDAYPVVVIGHGLWQRVFQGAADVVGRTLTVNERTVEVVGVLEEDFGGVSLDAEVWIPLSMYSLVGPADRLDARGTRFLPVIGRLARGATVADAQAEFEGVAAALQAEFPDTHEDRFARLVPFREGYLGDTDDLLWILFGSGALLLLIASANVANLLLVRAHARRRELTVRRAMGAGSERITSQLLTESLLIAALGGALGLVGASLLLDAALPLVPDGVLPGFAEPALSTRAFLFTLVVLMLVGLGAGTTPAVTSARARLADGLRAGRGALAGRGGRAQKAFVVTQVGLALVLLFGAATLTRSFRAQLAVDPGLEFEGIHTLVVQPPQERYPDGASLQEYSDELLRRVGAVPGVEAVTVASDVPFRGGSSGSFTARQDDPENPIRIHRHSVDAGFFDLLGVEVLAGRTFEDFDDRDAPGVVVVSQAFVERVFPEAPTPSEGVGRRVWIGNPADPENLAEIVGVIENVRFRNLTQSMLDGPNSPDLFFSRRQVPMRTQEVAFRVAGVGEAGAAVVADVRRAVQAFDPATPPFAEASLRALYDGQTATPRLAAVLMGAFGFMALLLAGVGLYGVLAFTVGQRAPEIALRRALGASGPDVARRVVADALRLSAFGVGVGGVAAFFGSGLLESLLFQVSAGDPVTLVATGLGVLLVATVAAAVPAARAARRSPAEALSAE